MISMQCWGRKDGTDRSVGIGAVAYVLLSIIEPLNGPARAGSDEWWVDVSCAIWRRERDQSASCGSLSTAANRLEDAAEHRRTRSGSCSGTAIRRDGLLTLPNIP